MKNYCGSPDLFETITYISNNDSQYQQNLPIPDFLGIRRILAYQINILTYIVTHKLKDNIALYL